MGKKDFSVKSFFTYLSFPLMIFFGQNGDNVFQLYYVNFFSLKLVT